jgi:TPR repeat protein
MQQNQHQHPVQTQTPPGARPPPVRQYNSDNIRSSYDSQQSAGKRQSAASHPVTYDELNRLRNIVKTNINDNATGLVLAKKLVEAASVLSDEAGTADTRTRNKNREKFILEAHKVLKKLVSNGYPDAMFYMADCHGQGLLGLQVDTKEAFTLYQSAAKGGHAASAYRTAVCCEMGHEEGGGTKRDPLKAVQWYRRAAALGDTPALYKMGMILLKGLLGQQRNLGEALNMLKRAAERADKDNPHALHELALIYESQTGNERIIQDEVYALQLFHQAADLGYKFSQFRLGQAYEYGLLGCQIDARTSIAWYTRAAAQEEHQSELALSGWYLTGTSGILEQSDTEAYLWARKAACAEPPLPKALFAMGYFTEVGIGCPRSLDEAKRWYGRAAGKFNLDVMRSVTGANVEQHTNFPKPRNDSRS